MRPETRTSLLIALAAAAAVPAGGPPGAAAGGGARAVVTAPANAPCAALITPGILAECGQVPVAGNRVMWVLESSPTTTAARAFTVRVFTFVTDESGWGEWLRAADAGGGRGGGGHGAR